MKIWNDPEWVARTPLITVGLFETANLGQIVRIWTHHTAAGQNLTSWFEVNVALWLWANFYRVMSKAGPMQARQFRFARWTLKIGIVLNTALILSVAYFRAIGRG